MAAAPTSANTSADDRLDLFRCVDSSKLFDGVCCRDIESRKTALDYVFKTVDGWIDGYGSPPNYANGVIDSTGCSSLASKEPKEVVSELLPDILRLSIDCPFKDVREKCQEKLTDLQDRGLLIPKAVIQSASSFIVVSPVSAITNSQTQDLLMEVFLQNNRLERVFQVMSLHPQYLDHFLRAHHYLLRGDGPLPFAQRHYIAIMAAASHSCAYLVNLQTAEFVAQQGDIRWLRGLDSVPEKIRQLAEISRILAHRPWLITPQHIQNLVQGGDDRQNNWSMSELMQAVVLLAHFHSLASFILGCGVNSEIDHPDGYTYSDGGETVTDGNHVERSNGQRVTMSHPPSTVVGKCIDSLLETMQKMNEEVEDDVTEDEMTRSFETIESQNAELTIDHTHKKPVVWGGSISRFVDDPSFIYEDFARRGEKSNMPTFRNRDFSWEDYGFSLAERFYMDIGQLLDEKFNLAQNLTYHTMGDKQHVDTRMFRHAVWYYIHSLFGIRHDDYNYGVINELLERSLKSYVKIVTCFPERVTLADYNSFMTDFKSSEKVHINIMLLEAKLQAELLYVFRAISKFMS